MATSFVLPPVAFAVWLDVPGIECTYNGGEETLTAWLKSWLSWRGVQPLPGEPGIYFEHPWYGVTRADYHALMDEARAAGNHEPLRALGGHVGGRSSAGLQPVLPWSVLLANWLAEAQGVRAVDYVRDRRGRAWDQSELISSARLAPLVRQFDGWLNAVDGAA